MPRARAGRAAVNQPCFLTRPRARILGDSRENTCVGWGKGVDLLSPPWLGRVGPGAAAEGQAYFLGKAWLPPAKNQEYFLATRQEAGLGQALIIPSRPCLGHRVTCSDSRPPYLVTDAFHPWAITLGRHKRGDTRAERSLYQKHHGPSCLVSLSSPRRLGVRCPPPTLSPFSWNPTSALYTPYQYNRLAGAQLDLEVS